MQSLPPLICISSAFQHNLSEFNTLAADQAIKLLQKSGSVFFKQGDKAGRLLAHRLRQNISSQQIPILRTSVGVTIDPAKINEEFKNYYESLYSSETNADRLEYDNFFSTLLVPQVGSDNLEDLEKPITTTKLVRAVKLMPTGKCPGPDRFTVEFYKCFLDKLAPLLIDMFNESFATSKLHSIRPRFLYF